MKDRRREVVAEQQWRGRGRIGEEQGEQKWHEAGLLVWIWAWTLALRTGPGVCGGAWEEQDRRREWSKAGQSHLEGQRVRRSLQVPRVCDGGRLGGEDRG